MTNAPRKALTRAVNRAIAEGSPRYVDTPYDQLGQIIAYEQGDLDDDATIVLFQHLVDNGMAWTLQGHYGRTAQRLIDEGVVTRK